MTEGALLGLAAGASPVALAQANSEPDWLLEDRMAAEALARELPGEANPLFTLYHDLRSVRFGEIAAYDATGDAADLGQVLPEGAAGLLHVVEDTVVARALSSEAQAAGVVLDTFARLQQRDPALLRRLLEGGETLPVDDRLAQATRAAFAIGVVLHVPDGVRLDHPIVLRWSVGAPGHGLLSRTVVSLGRGAGATILEEQDSPVTPNGRQSLWTGTTELHLGPGATLDFAGMENFGPNTVAFVNRHAILGEEASLTWALATVGGALVKSRIDNVLVGRGSGVQQAEIGFGSGSQLFDLTSYTRHRGLDTTGNLLSKGVFEDQARGFMKGLIDIERSAKGTDSFLGEFGMLLNKKARSVTIPSLEIDQPDVRRASHSSAVGPIDESQVFYLMSRGISRDLARRFIVLGFLEPVVARIPLESAQEQLRELLDRKWKPAA